MLSTGPTPSSFFLLLPEGQTNFMPKHFAIALKKGKHIRLEVLFVRHLDLKIHPVPDYPGEEDPGAVLGDQQQHIHLADHLGRSPRYYTAA